MTEPVPLAVTSLAVLAVGALLGFGSRLLLRGRSSMSAAGSVLAGIVGSIIGGTVTHLVTGAPDVPRIGLVLAFSVIGTVGVLLVAERFVHQAPPSAVELIEAGESARVEFKSTARHNVRTGQRDERLEAVVAKTVAGFLNASGGTLLIGVDDAGVVLGLDDDLRHMKAPDLDRYELWLHDFLTRVLGAPAVSHVRVSFPVVGGRPICRVDASRSPRPVFVRPPRSDLVQFFARIGNSTRELSVAEAIDYAVDHFHRRRRPRR
jgi:uncharacterized membrane protein YeaQ/YmgE (transglycosylase-associated protein family)